ncbi:MAG: 1,4-alpha-glucan branching protein domain-containing protein [Clostridia bacterium]|nr:1,4-alpha-glucan branching protein domain-containing protein [Clostridia bacterium]
MPQGCLALVLHAHLPYVRHLDGDSYLEEKWFYEALTETYLPIYMMLSRVADDGVPYRITMSLSPTLVSMFLDPLLQERYERYINSLLELAEREVERTRTLPEHTESAVMYRDMFARARECYLGALGRNMTEGFADLSRRGVVELITTGASHGYLPLMEVCPEAARAQVIAAVDYHTQVFGTPPPGMWLPECGYSPGVDTWLAEAGIKYFFTDAHGITNAAPRPRYGVYAPVYCPTGVAAFGRDMESSKQVWSAHEGYPGDYDYREFYRDIGHDLDWDYIRPYMNNSPVRTQTGIKYYRVTGRGEHKEPYVRKWAIQKARDHAGNFVFNRERQVEHLAHVMDRQPIVVAPYDAELFGHWWFEGIDFLEHVIRTVASGQGVLGLATPSDYLKAYPRNQTATPSMSSWGYMGYSEVWLADCNNWVYRHLHMMSWRMADLARSFAPPQPKLAERALAQAARELLLAQSSDWAFMMKAGACVDYAVNRTRSHVSRFNRLYDEIRGSAIDETWLSDIESKDNIFPDIDYTVYAGSAGPT